MKKVTPKSVGVKLNGKWCFKGQEEIISEEEYEVKKEFVNVLEDIKESNERTIEIVVKDENVDIEKLKEDIEVFVENYGKEPMGTPNENTDANSDGTNTNPEGSDDELETLRKRAKELDIKNAHAMKKETLIAKIEEAEKAGAGENQNPDGE